jgi:hypothetical protein
LKEEHWMTHSRENIFLGNSRGEDNIPPTKIWDKTTKLWCGASHPVAFATLTVSLLVVEKILESDK